MSAVEPHFAFCLLFALRAPEVSAFPRYEMLMQTDESKSPNHILETSLELQSIDSDTSFLYSDKALS